ncbi:MAG: ribosome biogenesis GTPase YlqF [Oscillospiraceae bacterium]|nr:ribosome biogenesis GTPase YlqF [Oscillospiraceae bacterium]
MNEAPSIQWFPGHMAKTRRMITANLKMVDAVVEITDARIPQSSRNPDLNNLISGKPRVILLNKCDEADDKTTEKWLNYYKSQGIYAMAADCRSGKGLKNFVPMIKEVLKDLLERRKAKGIIGAPLHLMIVGIPNVGKSSFINRMAKSKKTKVEDRPGVTREKQWVKIDEEIELLDMPGVLWPKFEDKLVGEKLAFTGAVKDDILDIELLASRLLSFLCENSYKDKVISRYNIEISDEDEGYEILEKVGRKRGMLISGGEVNTERAAITVLDEFRSGKLGKITLEEP